MIIGSRDNKNIVEMETSLNLFTAKIQSNIYRTTEIFLLSNPNSYFISP